MHALPTTRTTWTKAGGDSRLILVRLPTCSVPSSGPGRTGRAPGPRAISRTLSTSLRKRARPLGIPAPPSSSPVSLLTARPASRISALNPERLVALSCMAPVGPSLSGLRASTAKPGLHTFYSAELGDALEEHSAHTPTGTKVGDGRADSGHAEGAALIWGMAWAVQTRSSPEFADAAYVFMYDATFIGDCAAGRSLLHADTSLGLHLFGLGALVRETCRATWEHVKAHSGHPLNELADGAAKFGRYGDAAPNHLTARTIDSFVHSRCACSWSWMCVAALDADRGLPNIVNGRIDVPLPQNGVPKDCWFSQADRANEREAMKGSDDCAVIRFQAASLNVLTLRDPAPPPGSAKHRKVWSASTISATGGLAVAGRTETRAGQSLHRRDAGG